MSGVRFFDICAHDCVRNAYKTAQKLNLEVQDG